MAKHVSAPNAHDLAHDSTPTPTRATARHPDGAARPVLAGDTAPALDEQHIEQFEVAESTSSAQVSKIEAVQDIVGSKPAQDVANLARMLKAILDGASPDDAVRYRRNPPATAGRSKGSGS